MAFQDLPIRQKLMAIILVISGVVLLMTSATFLAYEFATFRQSQIRELTTLGEIIAANSTAAVAFDNQRDATEILGALKAERHIVAAALYDKQGELFAHYPAEAAAGFFPPKAGPDGYRFETRHLAGFAPVVQVKGSGRLGTLYLKSDMEAMNERFRLYGVIALLVVTASAGVAYVLSRKLQHQISRPILALAEAAQAVSDRRDYSVRARKYGEDELGLLTEAFNHMLDTIQQQNESLENRVRERTAELESANDELEAFGSSAAHDLRTPLRAITGLADVLLDPRAHLPPADAERHLRMIRDGSAQMSELINALLAFSRLGRQPLTRSTVDLNQLCREALKDLAGEQGARRAELRLQPLPSVEGDPALLRIVFVNLLSNALKYSRPRPTAVIDVGVDPDQEEGVPVFYVRDNGVGFDMRDSAKLFGVFQRLHLAREFEGTGVGLATVRRIIERHGGRIWAESVPDGGAIFFFTLTAPADPD
jgi:signal transduction histidine kinase